MAILITVLAKLSRLHYAFASAFGSLSDRNNQGVDMRVDLIKMNLEADYVFLSVPFGAPVIDIFCPLFDFRTSLEMDAVCSLVQIYGLGFKCHLKRTVMITSEGKFRTTVWLNFAVRLERFPAQFSQVFLFKEKKLVGIKRQMLFRHLAIDFPAKPKALPATVRLLNYSLHQKDQIAPFNCSKQVVSVNIRTMSKCACLKKFGVDNQSSGLPMKQFDSIPVLLTSFRKIHCLQPISIDWILK